jgi:hypothetical protein
MIDLVVIASVCVLPLPPCASLGLCPCLPGLGSGLVLVTNVTTVVLLVPETFVDLLQVVWQGDILPPDNVTQPAPGVIELEGLVPGQGPLAIVAVDAAGNMADTTFNITMLVKTDPPETQAPGSNDLGVVVASNSGGGGGLSLVLGATGGLVASFKVREYVFRLLACGCGCGCGCGCVCVYVCMCVCTRFATLGFSTCAHASQALPFP